MVKRIFIRLTIMFFIILGQLALAGASGLLFNVSATGTPANVSITLCLNGKGALSCQTYNVSALTLSIITSAPNHVYPLAGIKINTPGYSLGNLGLDCTPSGNGYCLFSVSNKQPATISISGASGYSISGTISNLTAIGLVLQNNGGDDLTVNSGATTFQFATPVAYGSSYNVTVFQQPTGLTCSVSNGSGANATANVTNVSLTCAPGSLIAAGQYSNGTTNYPLLANSTNGGATWTYSITSSAPTLPSDYSNSGTFSGASCSGLNCVAAGGYSNGTTYYPLLANSTNGGATWTYSITSSATTLPSDYINYGRFNGASVSMFSLLPDSLRFVDDLIEPGFDAETPGYLVRPAGSVAKKP